MVEIISRLLVAWVVWRILKLLNFSDAEVIYKQCWMSRKSTLGERDPSTLDSFNRYASAFSCQDIEDKHTEALDLFNQLLVMQKDVIGSDHPDTLSTMDNIGLTYWGLDRLTEALSMYSVCFTRRKAVLGENHPSTISTQDCILVIGSC